MEQASVEEAEVALAPTAVVITEEGLVEEVDVALAAMEVFFTEEASLEEFEVALAPVASVGRQVTLAAGQVLCL